MSLGDGVENTTPAVRLILNYPSPESVSRPSSLNFPGSAEAVGSRLFMNLFLSAAIPTEVGPSQFNSSFHAEQSRLNPLEHGNKQTNIQIQNNLSRFSSGPF